MSGLSNIGLDCHPGEVREIIFLTDEVLIRTGFTQDPDSLKRNEEGMSVVRYNHSEGLILAHYSSTGQRIDSLGKGGPCALILRYYNLPRYVVNWVRRGIRRQPTIRDPRVPA